MKDNLEKIVQRIDELKERYKNKESKHKLLLGIAVFILSPCAFILKLNGNDIVKIILALIVTLIMFDIILFASPILLLYHIWCRSSLKTFGKLFVTSLLAVIFAVCYVGVTQETDTETESTTFYSEETKEPVTESKHTEKQTELITETTTKKELNSVYSKLTDKQFALLTEMMAKSFYSFSLSKEEHKTVESDSAVMSCLTQIYSYAYDHYFELDPEYKEVFATKYEVVSKISNYETLKENFAIEYYFDNKTQNWVYTINSYSLNKNDVVEYDDKLYIDAEGYLNKGVIVYWLNDGVMEASGEIKDTAYNKEINGTTYAYAVNIEYYDDPYASGWTDGEIILRVNKNFSGKPLYYVNVQDANRKIIREEIDFSGSTVWKPLKSSKPSVGTEVYSGITHSKSYVFTIVGIDISSDSMLVSYPSGTTEYKSYSAIMNNEYLFVKL